MKGKKFGKLTVIEYAGQKSRRRTMWKCICDCGNIVVVDGTHLRDGHTKSCGCLSIEHISKLNYKNGLANTKLQYTYNNMNLVRNRVEMPGLDESIITPGEKLREAILHERAVEFGFEEVRYFDINRWKRDDYLKAKLHRLRITKENDKLSYEVRYDMLHKRVYIERWDNRYFLIPIPQGEINKKYGLVQNPGWE